MYSVMYACRGMADSEGGAVGCLDGSLTLSRDIRRACQLLEKLQVHQEGVRGESGRHGVESGG